MEVIGRVFLGRTTAVIAYTFGSNTAPECTENI
jgi:hypothetical protein